ncbi:MAG: HD domain-containing protein [Clostridiales Family XIII bacterium]|jgi:putative two-component system response regulator|nr:HD domain-containing protein [Clostridiales Family XIII bacterium]
MDIGSLQDDRLKIAAAVKEDADLRQVADILGSLYDITPVRSPEELRRLYTRGQADLVLIDAALWASQTLPLVRELAERPRAKAPIVLIAGRRDDEAEAAAFEAGACDVIDKPIRKNVFLQRIQHHLRLSAYRESLTDQVKELEDSIVQSFAELVECRDRNTGGHIARTSKYVALIGMELQDRGQFAEELTDGELAIIVRAAPLHDIGKIGISDLILLKPGKLDDDEFAVMKSHSQIGADLLREIYRRTPTQDYLKYAIAIAESHHEKFDGTGYPNRIKGDDIPVSARIMAVADVYDALVADRVYRKAMSHEQAYGIITEGKGTAFDPRVVEAFAATADVISAVAQKKD